MQRYLTLEQTQSRSDGKKVINMPRLTHVNLKTDVKLIDKNDVLTDLVLFENKNHFLSGEIFLTLSMRLCD